MTERAAPADGASPRNTNGSSGQQVGGHSLTYVLSSMVALLGSIVLLPIYTRALDPADYGLLETILRFVGVCTIAAFGGLQQGYMRFFFDDSSPSWQRTLTSTTLTSVAVLAAVVMLPLLVGISFVGSWLGLPQFSLGTSCLLAAWLAFETAYLIGLSFLQVRFLSSRYFLAQSARVAVLVCSNVVLLHFLDLGLNGALLGNFLAAFLSGLVSAALLFRWSGKSFDPPTAKGLLKFGAPYIPTTGFAYVVTNADRLALLYFGFSASLGLLSLAAKLGEMALSVLTTPLRNIWMPYAFAVHAEQDGPEKIGLLYMRYVSIMVLLGVVLSLGAPVAIELLTTEAYSDASELVPLVAIASIFLGTSNLADIGILIAKRTNLKPPIFAAIAAIAVVLQLLLTPRAGVVGAITATSLTAIAQHIIISTISHRYYAFQINQRKMLVIVLAGALGFFAGRGFAAAFPTIPGMLVSVCIGTAIFLVALHFTRLITYSDVKGVLGTYLQKSTASA